MRASLLTLCLLPSLALAQTSGDYRLDGRDSRDDPYTAEVSIQRVAGVWTLTRTMTHWADEDRVQRPVTWVASKVEKSGPGELRVRFGGKTGIAGLLDTTVNQVDRLDEPVYGTYTFTAGGELEEALESAEPVGGKKGWEAAWARGGRDFPVLVLEREAKLEDLFGDGLSRYEASGVVRVGDELVMVFDNARTVARVPLDLDPSGAELIETHGHGPSDFEGVTYDPLERRFYFVVEADRHHGELSARLWELDADLTLDDKEWLPYEPPSRGKGFEGLTYVRRDGEDHLLALLEGNHGKSDERSVDRGHGKVVVFDRDKKDWAEVASFDLPPEAVFSDYSGIDVQGDRIAVVSQTSSLLWVGTLAPDRWEVVGPGRVLRFPREHGVAVYASVEGVTWLSPDRVAVVSDRYHGKAEPAEAKDQSVHLFRLPE